ncbi:RING finger protein 44 [Plakobranchus ocellatus]|uniref:RING finger protein 44 n=1 Tax=Plakobranchus ocellatus TaxID=259542 RepID=A0AAV3ZY58_9GAST|nr:RING finger protein 44 [Plakobranchus ocellatus]
MAQSQVLPLQLYPASNQSQPDNRQGQEISVEDEYEATAMQPGLQNHRPSRHRHHRREHNLHQAAANHPDPVRTQTQPQNPQKPEPQDALTESSGQREAMAQSQPLPSDRPTQTHSNSVSSQELSVQSTPSKSADEREAMAPQQPLRLHQPCSVQTQSQPDNRQEHESSLHGNQSQQPNTNSQDHEDSVRVAQMALRRLIRELPQRTRDSLILWHRDGLQLPRVDCEDRVDMSLDILMAALKSVPVIPEEATNYRALFHLCESVKHSLAQHFITEAIQHNATATQNNAIVIQHRVAIAQHLAEEAQHNAKVTQHFTTVTEHIAAAVPNNDVVTQHIIAATQHISAAIRHNDAATQRRSALRRHIAAATHNNADLIGQIPDYHSSPDNGLNDDKIQEIPTRQYSRSADRSGSDQTSCVFCMCDFEDKQLLRILPCFHEFHAECVDEWLKTHRTCPVCRHDVTENRSKS